MATPSLKCLIAFNFFQQKVTQAALLPFCLLKHAVKLLPCQNEKLDFGERENPTGLARR
jgi:hypothetical protein